MWFPDDYEQIASRQRWRWRRRCSWSLLWVHLSWSTARTSSTGRFYHLLIFHSVVSLTLWDTNWAEPGRPHSRPLSARVTAAGGEPFPLSWQELVTTRVVVPYTVRHCALEAALLNTELLILIQKQSSYQVLPLSLSMMQTTELWWGILRLGCVPSLLRLLMSLTLWLLSPFGHRLTELKQTDTTLIITERSNVKRTFYERVTDAKCACLDIDLMATKDTFNATLL
jgi:hypothetical protein